MTLLPEHARLLAQVHHRELVAAARSHQYGGWFGSPVGYDPTADCRVPAAPTDAAPGTTVCRPDPRRRPASRLRRLRGWPGRSLKIRWRHWPRRSHPAR